MVTFLPLKQARENGAILLIIRCLSPNLPTLYLILKKANHLEEFLDRTLQFGIGFGALNDGDILAP